MGETSKSTLILEIPRQQAGGCHDTETIRTCSSEDTSQIMFSEVKRRLFSINQWKTFSGVLSAEFAHTDPFGNRLERYPVKGDLIRIKLPLVPKYDWVEIARLISNQDDDTVSVLMRCRPCKAPASSTSHISHFYSKRATSNFILEKRGNEVRVGVYGRNETINYNATFFSSIRNFLTVVGGLAGIAKLQWYFLVKGLTDFGRKM